MTEKISSSKAQRSGPNCEKHPDIIDISKVAFESLAPLSQKDVFSGTAKLIGNVDRGYKKAYLGMNTSSGLGIVLDEKIPNTYRPGEAITINATVQDGKEDAIFFMLNTLWRKILFSNTVTG